MQHKSIQINQLSLSFSHKTCFEEFSTQVQYGERIGIMGANGSGKSTLLKIIQGMVEPTGGNIILPNDLTLGYVPQLIEISDLKSGCVSGGERFNKALTETLNLHPNLLLLDEPTNHLDYYHRQNFMNVLKNYSGTLIIVSHDTKILRENIDTLWHIHNEKISVFSGCYDDYMRELKTYHKTIQDTLVALNRGKKDVHQALMKEQSRSAKSRSKGEKNIKQRKWPTVVSVAKASRGQETSWHKKAMIDHKKQVLLDQLSTLRLPEILKPTFSLSSSELGTKIVISIQEGSVGYEGFSPIIQGVYLTLHCGEKIAFQGCNGSGKSTLLKAILNQEDIIKSGIWLVPTPQNIGYLDQHYGTLNPRHSVLETLSHLRPEWDHGTLRRHLNDFLFRKNEEVSALTKTLSGGEKARLSLACIGAKTPRLLIVDEVTNNLDLETKDHIISALKNYPGAMIIVSHDEGFLRDLGIDDSYRIEDGKFANSHNASLRK
jgi:ATPase subunit of ABC transporter with duplicated ATPase domains